MSVPQSRLLICLLTSSLLASSVFADTVLVNTTTDENNIDNTSCSLREAVNYLNAKNVKKAVNDEEVAVISGVSVVLITELKNLETALTDEKDKPNPDPIKIAALETEISQLNQKIDAGILGLNNKLNAAKTALAIEKENTTPDTALISLYEADIKLLEAAIQNKKDEKAAKEKEMADYREQGLFGCVSSNNLNGDIILLKNALTPYLLNSPLVINLPVEINAEEPIPVENTDLKSVIGLENYLLNPVIQASGNHRLFIIDDGLDNDHDNNPATEEKRIAVSFRDIDFIGCDALCATDGGLFLNKEALTLTKSVLSKGQANRGGAIYNDEKAILMLKHTVFKQNQAVDGAAIFSTRNSLSIDASLIIQNIASNNNNGVITISSDASVLLTNNTIPHIENVTISGNEGAAISSYGNLGINNTTIVDNTIGVTFNNMLPAVFNSIIAGNKLADCRAIAPLPVDNKVYFSNNLSVINKGCPTGSVNNQNLFISNTGEQTLFAALDANNNCAAPPANGLLCPLADNGGLTKTHKPRLLASYTQLSDSPIVNKGFNNIITSKGFPCSTLDQRGYIRKNNEDYCDIGAVEIQSGLSSSTQGDDIVFGQIKRFSPLLNISDAELLPASLCSTVLGSGEYLNGCIRLINPPKYGSARFDPVTSDIFYSTNNPTFHGFDKFSYSIVTTLSRFSDAINDRTLTTQVRVVSEPPGSLPSKSLDSGAMSFYSLFMLSLLMLWRRIR